MKMQGKSENIQNFVNSAGNRGRGAGKIAGKRKKHAEIEECHSQGTENVIQYFNNSMKTT
jgi:hypothetical protein